MADSISDNRRAMCSMIEQLDPESLVLFPECALTGFHRGLKSVSIQGEIEESCEALQRDCNDRNLSIVFGTPWLLEEGFVNAAVYLSPEAPRQVAAKVGLTESERQFFAPGRGRPVFHWRGRRFSILFCREILDDEDPGLELAEDLDFILWPGYIAWSDDSENYQKAARTLAKRHGCAIYQCNWPESLNNPEQKQMGGSLIIDAHGDVVQRAAFDGPERLTLQL